MNQKKKITRIPGNFNLLDWKKQSGYFTYSDVASFSKSNK